jgi:hypothetical protein
MAANTAQPLESEKLHTDEPGGQGLKSTPPLLKASERGPTSAAAAPDNAPLDLASRTAPAELTASVEPAPVQGASEGIESRQAPVAAAAPAFAVEPRIGFFRENAASLVFLLLGGVVTGFCFLNWLRSYLWPAQARPIIPNPGVALLAATEQKRLPFDKDAPRQRPAFHAANAIPRVATATAGQR